MTDDREPFVLSLLGPDSDRRLDLREPLVVELLLRRYMDKCLEALQTAVSDTEAQDDAVEDIARMADALNDVFLGQVRLPNLVIHAWNMPERLGAALHSGGYGEGAYDSVRSLLVQMATRLMQALRLNRAAWKAEHEQIVGETKALLLGQETPIDRTRLN